MSKYGRAELLVGIFVIAAFAGLVMLAFKVSGLTKVFDAGGNYTVTAQFTEIGGLKQRARVTVAGVQIGTVSNITLDDDNFNAVVSLKIDNVVNNLPTDTIASIATSGLIGDNYVMLQPGADEEYLKNGGVIEFTDPAIVLERLIGQFLYRIDNK
jgi:phospholipid/cholesterol/gamma-HCH transport system substrate-binding protein